MWGDYDGGSGGSGFIQSQGTSGANNQSGVRKGNNSSLLPCAISHVLMAAPGGQEDSQSGGLVVNGVELHTVCVCGIVRGIEVSWFLTVCLKELVFNCLSKRHRNIWVNMGFKYHKSRIVKGSSSKFNGITVWIRF